MQSLRDTLSGGMVMGGLGVEVCMLSATTATEQLQTGA